MMYWGSHMTTGGWIFSIFGTLIILGLIVAAISWLIRDRDSQTASNESAREILDRRLASSELSLEQYNEMRTTLADEQATTPDPRPPRPASAPG
jgi:uncharacterized membrane protein